MTGIFRPFDTPAMYALDWRAWVRFGVSIALLNVVPLIYFVIAYNSLTSVAGTDVTFGRTLGLLVLSLAGFGFYRVYFGVMLLPWGRGYLFYGSNLPDKLKGDLDQRNQQQTNASIHSQPQQHLHSGNRLGPNLRCRGIVVDRLLTFKPPNTACSRRRLVKSFGAFAADARR